MDNALLELRIIDPKNSTKLELWYKHKVCQNCRKKKLSHGSLTDGHMLSIDTSHEYDFIITNRGTAICQELEIKSLGECGHYNLKIDIKSNNCKLSLIREPINSIKYLYIALSLLLAVFIALSLLESTGYFNKFKIKTSSGRICSLDAFRGFSVFWMIFFNYGSGGYKFLQHSAWDGLGPADFVFPWFIWIMGFSIPISIRSLTHHKNQTKPQIFRTILSRSAKLFLTGIFTFSIIGPRQFNPTKIRIPGVLQRISVCYFFVASSELILISLWKPILAMIFLSSVWLYISFFFPVPGCPLGYLGPGGNEITSNYSNCTGGSAGYIDNLILGRDHLYSRGSIKTIYQTNMKFDPEGLLGTLNAIVLTYIGALSGRITLIYSNKKQRFFAWILMSAGFLGFFYTLTGFKLNDATFPVNKNLWTLSYNLLMASSSLMMMSLFYYLIDIRGYWFGFSFFVYLGLNSTIVYVMHYLFGRVFPLYWHGVPYTHLWQLVMNLWGSCFWSIFAGFLHYKKIYLSF